MLGVTTKPNKESEHVPWAAQPLRAVRRHHEVVTDSLGTLSDREQKPRFPITDGAGWKGHDGLECFGIPGAKKVLQERP